MGSTEAESACTAGPMVQAPSAILMSEAFLFLACVPGGISGEPAMARLPPARLPGRCGQPSRQLPLLLAAWCLPRCLPVLQTSVAREPPPPQPSTTQSHAAGPPVGGRRVAVVRRQGRARQDGAGDGNLFVQRGRGAALHGRVPALPRQGASPGAYHLQSDWLIVDRGPPPPPPPRPSTAFPCAPPPPPRGSPAGGNAACQPLPAGLPDCVDWVLATNATREPCPALDCCSSAAGQDYLTNVCAPAGLGCMDYGPSWVECGAGAVCPPGEGAGRRGVCVCGAAALGSQVKGCRGTLGNQQQRPRAKYSVSAIP